MTRNSNRVFFSKADLEKPVSVPLTDTAIRAIFDETVGETIALYNRLLPSTYSIVYNVQSTTGNSYILHATMSNTAANSYQIETVVKRFVRYDGSRILHIDVSRKKHPFYYKISTPAVGEHLYATIDLHKKDEQIFNAVGRAMKEIHSVRTKGYGPIDPSSQKKLKGVCKTWNEFLITNLEEHISILKKNGVLDIRQGNRILKLFSGYTFIPGITPVLLHGDIANHNIFIDPVKKYVEFIDWEDALSGDYIYDIAYWGTASYQNMQWIIHVLKGYFEFTKLPSDFWLRYYTYYLRIAIMKSVIHLRFPKKTSSYNLHPHTRIFDSLVNIETILNGAEIKK